MKKHLFWIASIALGAVACTDKDMAPEDVTTPDEVGTEQTVTSNLTTAHLKSYVSDQNRVVVEPQTKAYPNPGELTLFATIENLSKNGGIDGFVREEDGRYLSATCVYYDQESGKYYVTYHMQGNNYNTQQENETSGFIESFTLDENGAPALEKVLTYANTDGTTMDFNHLYFDDLRNASLNGGYSGTDSGVRFIVAGHSSKGKDQKAMIGLINFEDESIDYSTVITGEKILDENGKSLGDENAFDVNAVIRKYDFYYLATRKGIAVLNAKKDNLFTPITNFEVVDSKTQPIENSVYFVRTPGSSKHFCSRYPTGSSEFAFLYITEKFPESYDGSTSLPASMITFSMNQSNGTLCGYGGQTGGAILNSKDFDITNWSLNSNQFPLGENVIYPIDGKNVTFFLDGTLYACLGKGGLYARSEGIGQSGKYVNEDIIKFTDAKDGAGSRPVNGVFVESYENYNEGFIYVANGSCLTILQRDTFEKVAEYSAFDAKADTNLASANYVHVVRTNTSTNGKCPDRIITVAYGQEGVKVFKFIPPTR